MYPLSRDQAKYERLIKILSLYRLSLGQARQEELIEYVLQSELDDEQIKELSANCKRHHTAKRIYESPIQSFSGFGSVKYFVLLPSSLP